jgi:hypothetical protein
MSKHNLNDKNLTSKKKLCITTRHLLGECEYYPDGVPCIHNGCMSHRTHICEYCGRIESVGDVYVPIKTT